MSEAKITDEQLKEEISNGLTSSQISNKYNMSIRRVQRRRNQLAAKGWSPEHDMTREVPDGFRVKGVSSYYNKHGKLTGQWVKSQIDHERQLEIMQEVVNSLCEDIKPVEPVKLKAQSSNDLLNCYIITDYHLGMMAWHEETRDEDWDLEIAEDLLYKWFEAAIMTSPNSEVGIFAQLADFMHWDGMIAQTPTSKHPLDADTRFQKLIRVAIRAIRKIINLLLQKHKKVVLIQPGGNHDIASTPWLREMFYVLYENEPRVEVDRTPNLYSCYEHGLTSLFFHHGHRKKITSLDETFAATFREVFGRTKYSYGHTGHYHYDQLFESSLMTIERHRTLASNDAYSSESGYVSGRSAKCITYHKNYGEVSRLIITPEMLK